ncbi:MAG: hypothetical protein ABEH40_01425 [Haloferacaceae archaeon]
MDDRTDDAPATPDAFADALGGPAAYVPPGYEVTDAPDAAGADGAADAGGAANALDAVVGALDRTGGAVVVVAGESGVGRSRLLAEVGRALRDRDGRPVRYARGPGAVEPPAVDGPAVLCLDDAGRIDNPDDVVRFAAGADGRAVVAAVRPVHAGTLDAGVLPDEVPRHELALDPLDPAGTADLLSEADVTPDRAREIHGTAGGNPFLSRRLAAAEGVDPAGATGGADTEGDTGPVAAAVEARLPDEADVRALLRSVAVLGRYDPDAPPDHPGVPDDGDARRRALDAARDAGHLAPVEHPGGTAFVLRDGVVAEHLRYRALVGIGGTSAYEAAVERCLGTHAVGVARGLVEFRESPLVRVGAVDAGAAAERARPLLADVAAGVIDADAPPAAVLRVQALVALVAPGALPHADLEAWWAAAEPGADAAGHAYRLAAALYRHAAATATDEHDLPVAPSTLFAHARTWLDHLNGLAIDRPGDAGLQRRLARALRAAAAHEAAAGRFEGARTCLDRLDVLAEDNPEDGAVRVALATALRDAAGAEGAAGRVDGVGTHVDRLSALADDGAVEGDDAVRDALATALVNAASYEGDAGRFDALSARIDRLAGLADDAPGGGEMDRRLAQGLLNAASAEAAAGRFGDAGARIDRLADLAASNPGSDEIRYRLAQALLGTADGEAAAGRFGDAGARIDRLADLVADNPDQADLPGRLAQALLALVDAETDAGRADDLPARIDRLADLAADHPDDDAVQVPATGGCLIALRGLAAAGRYGDAAGAVDALGSLADGGFSVGWRGADVAELAADTGERLLRDGRLDLFERFAAVLASGLSDGRWRSVSGDLVMTADTLVGEGALSMDEYRRVIDCCED